MLSVPYVSGSVPIQHVISMRHRIRSQGAHINADPDPEQTFLSQKSSFFVNHLFFFKLLIHTVPRDGRFKSDLEKLKMRLLSIFVSFIAVVPDPGEPNRFSPGY